MKTHCVLFQETVYFSVLQSHDLHVPHLANKPHINLIYDSGLHLFPEKKIRQQLGTYIPLPLSLKIHVWYGVETWASTKMKGKLLVKFQLDISLAAF